MLDWISLYCGSYEGFWIIYCGRERIETFEKRDKISGLFKYKLVVQSNLPFHIFVLTTRSNKNFKIKIAHSSY
jgi:hypothetical protein